MTFIFLFSSFDSQYSFFRKEKDEKEKDDKVSNFQRATQQMSSVGASLRASSRAEFGSNLLHRSASIRQSTKATQFPMQE